MAACKELKINGFCCMASQPRGKLSMSRPSPFTAPEPDGLDWNSFRGDSRSETDGPEDMYRLYTSDQACPDPPAKVGKKARVPRRHLAEELLSRLRALPGLRSNA